MLSEVNRAAQSKDVAISIRISQQMDEAIRDRVRCSPDLKNASAFFRYAAEFALKEADPALQQELQDIRWDLKRLAGAAVRYEASHQQTEVDESRSFAEETVLLMIRIKRVLDRLEDRSSAP